MNYRTVRSRENWGMALILSDSWGFLENKLMLFVGNRCICSWSRSPTARFVATCKSGLAPNARARENRFIFFKILEFYVSLLVLRNAGKVRVMNSCLCRT